jgi:hypothetical protein
VRDAATVLVVSRATCTALRDIDFSSESNNVAWTKCSECFRKFATTSCMATHKQNGTCKRLWKCWKKNCRRVISRTKDPPKTHVCSHTKYCKECKKFVSDKHQREQCFVRRKALKAPSKLYLFADIECTQETGTHRVNHVCTKDFDGEMWTHHTAREFIEWLTTHKKSYTVIMHNASGYDLPVLYETIVRTTAQQQLHPIYVGGKIIHLTIGGRDKNQIRFIDSMSFMKAPLCNLPHMMGVTDVELRKGFFPHWFSTAQTQNYEGALPAKHFFRPESMTGAKHQEFETWWTERNAMTTPTNPQFTAPWNLKRELAAYCENDVDILRTSCLRFRELFMSITENKCDPFQYVTIAGTVFAIYKALYMPADTIANLPPFISSQLRKAFYGGRTETRQVLWTQQQQHSATEVVKYNDITSQYPFVNSTCEYPLGHPKLIGPWTRTKGTEPSQLFKRAKASGVAVDDMLRNFDIGPYLREGTLAIFECDVTCPDNLFHPILPHRADNGALLFDLITKKRQWYTSVELRRAMKHGYVVTRVYRCAFWETTTTSLFQQYMRTFLKIKREASGWPKTQITNEQKRTFIADFAAHEGIALDSTKMTYNVGLRTIAKLCCNSLWGRWSLRPNLPMTAVVHTPNKLHSLICAPKYDDQRMTLIEMRPGQLPHVEVSYRLCDEMTQTNGTNVTIGVFTTSHARMLLYDALHKLQEQVLYMDTDSVIYKYDVTNREHKQLETGDYLGDWTDELDGHNAVKFVSGGPKCYAYEMDHGVGNSGNRFVVKIKGINLGTECIAKQLNMQRLTDMVRACTESKSLQSVRIREDRIVRDKRRKRVKNQAIARSFCIVLQKGQLMSDGQVLPFGHRRIHESTAHPVAKQHCTRTTGSKRKRQSKDGTESIGQQRRRKILKRTAS